jgi:hypothetical protein
MVFVTCRLLAFQEFLVKISETVTKLDGVIVVFLQVTPGEILVQHLFRDELIALEQKLLDSWGLCDSSVPGSEFETFRSEVA